MKSFQERANELIQQGNQAKVQGRSTEAIRIYREAIELVPGYGSLHLVIADMLFEEQAYAQAAAAYRQAIEFTPDHDQAWAGLGQCLLLLEEREEALAAFEVALDHNPQNAEANYYGAMLNALQDDPRKAGRMLFAALTARPAWEAQAREDALLGPLFEQFRKLSGLGSQKKWWEVWR